MSGAIYAPASYLSRTRKTGIEFSPCRPLFCFVNFFVAYVRVETNYVFYCRSMETNTLEVLER